MRNWLKHHLKHTDFKYSTNHLKTMIKEVDIELKKSKLAKLKKRMKSRKKRKRYYKNFK